MPNLHTINFRHLANYTWLLALIGCLSAIPFSGDLRAAQVFNDPTEGQGSAEMTVWTTGANVNGELGVGDTTQRRAFTQIVGGPADRNISAVVGGRNCSMALADDGTLWATGASSHGQLGFGDTCYRTIFSQVEGGLAGLSVTAVAGGYRHSLALTSDGRLWATGYNFSGELGLNGTNERRWFTQVRGDLADKRIVAIAGKDYHSLALASDGTLWAAGDNAWGELGLGDTTERHSFTPVDGYLTGKTVTAIAAGQWHSLALTDDGALWATGYNACGQLGLGDTADRHRFTQVGGDIADKTVVAITTGKWFSFALCSDGTLWGAGDNSSSQLGLDGGVTNSSFTQVSDGLAGKVVTAIAAGERHSLALASDGSLWATGSSLDGQLGMGDTTGSARFTKVSGPSPVVHIAAGSDHSLIVARTWTLNVQSTPVTGVAIASATGHGGTTDYRKAATGNTMVTLTALPTASDGSADYHFLQWNGTPDDTVFTDDNRTISFAIQSNLTVTSEYAIDTWTLDVKSSPFTGVEISSTTGHGGTTDYEKTLNDNETVELTAPVGKSVGETDYHFVQWSGVPEGAEVSDGGRTVSFSMNVDVALTAEYAIETWTLAVNSQPIAGIPISSTTGHGGTTNYERNVGAGAVVTLTAPATAGSRYFQRWVDDAGVALSRAPTISLTVNASTSLTAVYGDMQLQYPSANGIGVEWGRTYVIQWKSSMSSQIRMKIELWNAQGAHWVLAPSIPNLGTWQWRVGDFDPKTQTAYPSGDGYRIRINAIYYGVEDYSDYSFSIGVPTSLEITGPRQVNEGASAQYRCFAHYDFGSPAEVTASVTWKASSQYAKLDKTGQLTAKAVRSDQPCTITASYGKGAAALTGTYDITLMNVR